MSEEIKSDDDESPVNEKWFIPSFPPRPDRPHEEVMLMEWKKLMLYQDHYSIGWVTRLEALLTPIPGGPTERAGCIATSFVLWVSMPVGNSFLDELFRLCKKSDDHWSKSRLAVSAWARENQLEQGRSNTLKNLINQRKEFFHDVTYADHRTIEVTLCWLMTDEGMGLYQKVMRNLYKEYSIPEKK